MIPSIRVRIVVALVPVVLAVGCGRTDSPRAAGGTAAGKTHDHGDGKGAHTHGADPHDVVITEKDVARPADFKDALKRIRGYRDGIERDAASDTPGRAHRALDELDFVLGWLPGLARDSKVPREHWEAVNTTAQDLREQFEKVHANIDNRKAPDFPAVKTAVDAGLARLEKVAAVPPTP